MGASLTRSNEAAGRKPVLPEGLRRRRPICFVTAPHRCHGIAFVATPRIPAGGARNGPREFFSSLLGVRLARLLVSLPHVLYLAGVRFGMLGRGLKQVAQRYDAALAVVAPARVGFRREIL